MLRGFPEGPIPSMMVSVCFGDRTCGQERGLAKFTLSSRGQTFRGLNVPEVRMIDLGLCYSMTSLNPLEGSRQSMLIFMSEPSYMICILNCEIYELIFFLSSCIF